MAFFARWVFGDSHWKGFIYCCGISHKTLCILIRTVPSTTLCALLHIVSPTCVTPAITRTTKLSVPVCAHLLVTVVFQMKSYLKNE